MCSQLCARNARALEGVIGDNYPLEKRLRFAAILSRDWAHIFFKNFSFDELRLIFGRFPCQEVGYIFFPKKMIDNAFLF